MSNFKFKDGTGCQVLGPSGSGKSSLLLRIIKYRNELFTPRVPDVVIWCHSGLEQKTLFQHLKEICPHIKFVVGLEELKKINFNPKLFHLLVLDDLYVECANSDFVNELFYRGNHHLGIFTFLVMHNTFTRGKWSLDIARNSRYAVLFNNKRDRRGQEAFARNVAGIKPADFHEIMRLVTKRNPYGYLVFDLHPATGQDFSTLTNITPDELPNIYFHIE